MPKIFTDNFIESIKVSENENQILLDFFLKRKNT